jgi:two-component system, chemotaxis family, sensor kinase CheA
MSEGTIDLTRFNQVFFEECAEHLAEMEQILVSLADGEPDDEQLNAIFRAAHSIKGGAGIFGFDDMTCDVISMQLAGHREGKEVSEAAIAQVTRRLQLTIDQSAGSGAATPAGDQPLTQGTGSEGACPPPVADSGLARYEIVFTPQPDIFSRGVRVEALINELSELAEPGEFQCRAVLEQAPELEMLEPERCLTRWQFTMASRAGREEIMEVFLFAADDEDLVIRELTEAAPSPATARPESSLPAEGYGAPATPLQGEEYPAPAAAPARAADETAGQPRRAPEAESSIRVNVGKVDQLINQVGELLITQAMLTQLAGALDPVLHDALYKCVAQLERNTRDLQGSVMSIRLVPISLVFNRFPRMVREIAAKLGKSVELKTSGNSTELDKNLIEKIADPLSHLVRNSLDHGLETAEARLAKGKPATGRLELSASQIGGRIVIEVGDDGAGLDRGRILAKAVERGIPCSESMSDEEVWQLIFMPGFSTADVVTDISGRGVGMDVVLKNVQAIGGRVQISSQPGRGARVTISLPLTLAIVEGLTVAAGGEKFIIPLNAIVESLQPKPEQLQSVQGREVVQVRGEYLAILRLHRLFNLEGAVESPERGILVLVNVEGERVAVLVDALLDEQQVVVKSVEANFRKVEGSAGATILGDGRVALILDVTELRTMHKKTN